jgi:type II secretory pathway pseudopilin PulG
MKAHLERGDGRVRRPAAGWASFTVIELLVVVAVVAILGCLLVPAMRRTQQRARRISCTSNLMQIGISFKTWGLDNKDLFPWQVLTNQAGEIRPEAATNVYVHFLVLSNELATPRALRCPADASRAIAADFLRLGNTNISYFVDLDAEAATPQMFLTGDRNLTNGLALTNHVLFLAPKLPAGWTHELHSMNGNVGLADGSVQQYSTARLQAAVTNAGEGSRLLMP